MAIDIHAHFPGPGFVGTFKPLKEHLEKYFRAKVVERTLEDMLRDYSETGVEKLVLLPIDASKVTGEPGDTNDAFAKLQEMNPERIISFATVDPLSPRGAVREIERAVKDLGLRGLKLHPQIQCFYPDDERAYPLYEACEDLGIPVLFHTGITGVGAGMDGGYGIKLDYGRPIYLDKVAADFPRLKIVMAHFGWPWHEEALAIALHKANVFIDLSAWAPKYIPEIVIKYADTLLSDKMLFGTDYPMLSPRRWLDEFRQLKLRQESREKILRKNAERLLGL
ncbi:MAG: amidohydrolase family protein [Aigarchaeota archaeon]|nr:amidohydrolase family protein [Candidatus Pelearchaeum maunauluense]